MRGTEFRDTRGLGFGGLRSCGFRGLSFRHSLILGLQKTLQRPPSCLEKFEPIRICVTMDQSNSRFRPLSASVLLGRHFILGLRPRDKAAMLVVNTKETFLLNLHQNRVHFPAERNDFVLGPQHGRRDVTCKPAIAGAH